MLKGNLNKECKDREGQDQGPVNYEGHCSWYKIHQGGYSHREESNPKSESKARITNNPGM